MAESAPYTTLVPVRIRKIHYSSFAASGIRKIATRKQP